MPDAWGPGCADPGLLLTWDQGEAAPLSVPSCELGSVSRATWVFQLQGHALCPRPLPCGWSIGAGTAGSWALGMLRPFSEAIRAGSAAWPRVHSIVTGLPRILHTARDAPRDSAGLCARGSTQGCYTKVLLFFWKHPATAPWSPPASDPPSGAAWVWLLPVLWP